MPTRGGEVVTAEGSTPMPSPSPTSSTSAGPPSSTKTLACCPWRSPQKNFAFITPSLHRQPEKSQHALPLPLAPRICLIEH